MGSKMKYFIAVGLGFAIIATYFVVIATGKDHPVNPASQYAIPVREIAKLEAKAADGDCTAAQRLALFYMNISLRYDDAVRWSRVAAKCPVLDYKETLFALLVRDTENPDVMKEVDRLVVEIEALDPKRASHLKQVVEEMRTKK